MSSSNLNFDVFLAKFQDLAQSYQSGLQKARDNNNNNNSNNNNSNNNESTSGAADIGSNKGDSGSDDSQLSEALDEQSIKTAVKRICQLGMQQSSDTLINKKFYEILSGVLIPSNNVNNESYLLIDIGWDLLTELFLLYCKDERFSSFLYEICEYSSPRELCIMFSEVFTHPLLSVSAISQHYEYLNNGSLHADGSNKIINDSPNIPMPDDLVPPNQPMQPYGALPSNKLVSGNTSSGGSLLDVLELHNVMNYSKLQSVFVQCVHIICKQLFENLEKSQDKKPSSKMDHYYNNLLPTTMMHFETLSKELSYHIFRKLETLREQEQSCDSNSHSHGHSHSRSLSLSSANMAELVRANEKLREEVRTGMSEYLQCVGKIAQLFTLLISNFSKQASKQNVQKSSGSSGPSSGTCEINFIELFHSSRVDAWDFDNVSDISTDNESDIRSQTGETANTSDTNDTSANASTISTNTANTGAPPGSVNNGSVAGDSDAGSTSNDEEIGQRKQLNMQRLWLIRFGFRILSGLYWWHSIEYVALNGDENEKQNGSKGGKKQSETFFQKCLMQTVTEVLQGLQKIGLNVSNLLQLQAHVKSMENRLQKFQPWSLHTPRSDEDPNSPLIRPKLNTSHSHPPELTTIVEAEDAQDEEEDDNDNEFEADAAADDDNNEIVDLIDVIDEEAEMPALSIESKTGGDAVGKAHVSHIADNTNGGGSGGDWNDITIDTITPTKQQRKKERRVQMIVDELQRWNEFLPLRGVSCYLVSLLASGRNGANTANGADAEKKEEEANAANEANKEVYKNHMETFWSAVKVLVQQPATILAGIEFGEDVLNNTIGKVGDLKISCKEDQSKLLNSVQFNHLGLWQLVQALTQMMGMNADPMLHRKLWRFINHIINASDIMTRFQCIASVAVKCPIPVVASLMFTELKNQMFETWNVDLSEEKTDSANDTEDANNANGSEAGTPTNGEDGNGLGSGTNPAFGRSLSSISNVMADIDGSSNPFVSRQMVMVLAQRVMKDANNANLTLHDVCLELDSLNACLNVIRFVILKDKEENRTNVFDEDCPLRGLLAKLNDKLIALVKGLDSNIEESKNALDAGDNANVAAMKSFEMAQKEAMKTQLLLTMDILKIILKSYTFSYSQAKQPPSKVTA